LAFDRWRLLPRVLRGGTPTLGSTVLGKPVSMPILVAPMTSQRMAHPDGELAARVPREAPARSSCSAQVPATPSKTWPCTPGPGGFRCTSTVTELSHESLSSALRPGVRPTIPGWHIRMLAEPTPIFRQARTATRLPGVACSLLA
jgi:hypothetical protein